MLSVTVYGQKSPRKNILPSIQRTDTVGAIVLDYYTPRDISLVPKRVVLDGQRLAGFTPIQENELLVNDLFSDYYQNSLLFQLEVNRKKDIIIDTLQTQISFLKGFLTEGISFVDKNQTGWEEGMDLATKYNRRNQRKDRLVVMGIIGGAIGGYYIGKEVHSK
jgi:hypothetical protein